MSENENDFDALRRLLALKRHEIPPPGYFENFSGQVIARIRAGDTAAELPWLLRFIQWFERRPAMPVTFASSMCLVLLYGIVSIQQTPGLATTGWLPDQGRDGLYAVQTPLKGGETPQLFSGGPNDTNSPINMAPADSQLFGSQPAYQPATGLSTGN